MPTVTYSNNPNSQNREGVVYAPNLPWWVDNPQPATYGISEASGQGLSDIYSGAQPGDRRAPAGETAGTVNPGVSSATPNQPTVGSGGGGGFSLDDMMGGFVPPVYGGGTGAKKTGDDLGFKFTPSTGGGQRSPTGSTSTQTTTREFVGDRPELELPERDERRVASLRQKAAAPGVRKLRTALNRALVRSYENPNVARMVTRSALTGFGEGLESVMGGAGREAEAQYRSELGLQVQEVTANYQAALQQFMGSATTTTTQKTQGTYGSSKTGDDRYRGQSRPGLGIA